MKTTNPMKDGTRQNKQKDKQKAVGRRERVWKSLIMSSAVGDRSEILSNNN